MNDKHRAVISSYSDISKLSSDIKIIHFRKFISKKILKIVLNKCPDLKEISFSNYASKRLNKECKKLLSVNEIIIKISFSKGRPNALELKRNINIDYKLIGEI